MYRQHRLDSPPPVDDDIPIDLKSLEAASCATSDVDNAGFGASPRATLSKKEKTNNVFHYDEDEILKKTEQYIRQTYTTHYSGKTQPSELIFSDASRGKGFVAGNIIKYASRLGKKGTIEDEEKDLMKIVHYAIIAIHFLGN